MNYESVGLLKYSYIMLHIIRLPAREFERGIG